MNFSAEKLAVLRIARSSGIGPVNFKKIVAKAGTPQDAVVDWKNLVKEKQLCSEDDARRELELIEKSGGWCVVVGEEDYPRAFEHLPDAPPVLTGLGNPKWLNARQVALVGNRNASAAGLQWTRTLASELSAHGLVITSGLARGIDSAAHRGALDAHGGTIAVVGGGAQHVYPPENAKLREEIIATGCLVSEQPWGSTPQPSFFARRNRIIAGLSLGTVVSEAGRESATLITARCALEYGREVWAVPGSPSDPRASGPNWLLKQGATLIEGAADIISTLPTHILPPPRAPELPLLEMPDEKISEEEMSPLPDGIAGLLGRNGVSVDALVRQTGKAESALMAELVEMELLGAAVRDADGTWRKS